MRNKSGEAGDGLGRQRHHRTADTAYTIGRWQLTASNGETWMTTTANTDVFDAQERIALARLACEANNFAEALRMLKPVLQAADVPAEALALGGLVYMQLRLFDRAEK